MGWTIIYYALLVTLVAGASSAIILLAIGEL
jgi:hypothetical protein